MTERHEAEREEVVEDASLDWAVAIAERAFEVLGYARESRDRDADIRLAMMLQDLAGRCSSQAERIAGVAAQEIHDSRSIVDAEVAEHVRVACGGSRWGGRVVALFSDPATPTCCDCRHYTPGASVAPAVDGGEVR